MNSVTRKEKKFNTRVIANGQFFIYLFISVSRPKKQRIESFAVFAFKDTQIHRKFYHLWLKLIPFRDAPIKHLLNASRFLQSHTLFCLHRNWPSKCFPGSSQPFLEVKRLSHGNNSLFFTCFTVWPVDLDFRAAWNTDLLFTNVFTVRIMF